MARWLGILVVVSFLAVGCASNETNQTADEIASMSASENTDASKADVVDNTVPPNQVTSSSPAQAAPVLKPVSEVPVQKSVVSHRRRHHKKVVHRKHKRRKHIAKKPAATE